MFEALMLVLFYFTPAIVFLTQAIKNEVDVKGYCTVLWLISLIILSLLPILNIVFMLAALEINGFFRKKLFVKGD